MGAAPWIARIAGYAGAPWTGGLSIAAGEGIAQGLSSRENDDDIKKALSGLDESSQRQQALAKESAGQSSELLNPAVDYLKAVLGGDRQALMEATMPERRRVIDQYDAAKKAISEFSPRGGGTAGALANVNASQASDLAVIGSQARGNAVNQAGILGANLRGQAMGGEQASAQTVNQMLQTYMQKGIQAGQTASELGEGLAGIIGMLYGPGGMGIGTLGIPGTPGNGRDPLTAGRMKGGAAGDIAGISL